MALARKRSNSWLFLLAACVLLTIAVGTVIYANTAELPDDSTFRIEVERNASGMGQGSAFLVSDTETLVTSFHVVEDTRRVLVHYLHDDRVKQVSADVIWYSRDQDLAILRTREPLVGSPLTLASAEDGGAGKREDVVAVGFPGRVGRIAAQISGGTGTALTRAKRLLDPTVSTGTIQRFVEAPNVRFVQHSANIHPGSSGGPLLDRCHRVVGVNALGFETQIDLRRILEAAMGGGVKVGSAGDLEYAVGVGDLIAALQRERIDFSASSGTCVMGMSGEMQALAGASTGGAVLAFALFAFSLFRREDAGIRADTHVENDGGGNDTPITVAQPSNTPVADTAETRYVLSELQSGKAHTLNGAALASPTGLSVGRLGSDVDLGLADSSVSRKHAKLTIDDGGQLNIRELGSTNGVAVNGQRIASNQSIALSDRNIITFGELKTQLRIHGEEPAILREEWRISGFDGSGNLLQISIFAPDDLPNAVSQGNTFREVGTIGRSSNNDFVIDESSVSRNHAVVGFHSELGIAVADMGSSNGTFVRGKPIGNEPVSVSKVGKFRVGEIDLEVTRIK